MKGTPGQGTVSSALMPNVSTLQSWYAVHTHSRHENKVAAGLAEKSVTTFLPTVRQLHNWSDRRKIVEVPVFPCYVFVRVQQWKQVHSLVLRTPGVFRWVGQTGEPTVIPDSQIDAVRSAVATDLSVSLHPFLKEGQRVRICSGSLEGVEGILVGKNKDCKLVISIDLLQQSIAVALEGYDVVAA